MSETEYSCIEKTVEPDVSVYLHNKAAALGIPATCTFELTSRCNFNCKMCYIHNCECAVKESTELSTEQWLDIGRQAAEAGTVFLLLTGGEPMMRKDFCDIYRGLKKLGFYITVNTNASMISDSIFEMFREDPPGRLNISLYGASEDTYERLCGTRSFNTVIDNIRKAIGYGIQIRLNFSITPFNRGDIAGVYKIAGDLGLNVKSTAYMYPPLQADNYSDKINCRFDPEKAAYYRVENEYIRSGRDKFLLSAEQLFNHISTYKPVIVNEGEKVRCRAGSSTCWINCRGEMSFCGMVNGEDNNVLEKGYLNSWLTVRSRTRLIRLPLKCTSCKIRAICNICASVCYSETGSYAEAPEYVCRMSEKTIEYIKQKAVEIGDVDYEKI